MGTGGTISGTAKYLKEQNPNVRVIGVDPIGSVYEYYIEHRELPPQETIHQYLIDGIGEDFMPSTVWWDYIDEIVKVDDKCAYRATRDLARQESIFTGSSGGAAAEAPAASPGSCPRRPWWSRCSPMPATATSRSSTRSGCAIRGCWTRRTNVPRDERAVLPTASFRRKSSRVRIC